MESINSTGSVTRGWIGVEPQDMTPEIAESFGLEAKEGALIAAVVQGGPADKAGVKPGDILVSVDGQGITDTTALLNAIAQLKPGAAAKMKVVRRGKPTELTVMIGKRPPPPRRALPLDEEE
jgi:serine protease DegQ